MLPPCAHMPVGLDPQWLRPSGPEPGASPESSPGEGLGPCDTISRGSSGKMLLENKARFWPHREQHISRCPPPMTSQNSPGRA